MDDITDGDLAARLRHGLDGRGTAPDLSPDLVAGAPARTAPRVVNRRKRLQVTGGLTLAVAAVAVGTLVAVAPFQRAPLFVAADASRAADEAGGSASVDMRIGPWIDYRYEPGAGLSTARGSGTVYQVKRTGSAEETLRAAARALGVSGDPKESSYSDASYPTYVIGPEDGSGPSVVVTWAGTGDWWFNDPGAYPAVIGCPAAGSSDDGDAAKAAGGDEDEAAGGDGAAMCTVPDTSGPNLAPSAAEARAQAQALFAATGLEVSRADIAVTADEWQTTATASLTVDGVRTAIDWVVAWAPSGRIAWAYGHSIEVVARGEYGTVSAADAVARLSDGRWYGGAGPDYQSGGMALSGTDSRGGGVAPAPAPDAPSSDAPASGADPGVVDPDAPVESPAEPTDPADPNAPATPEKPAEPDPGEAPPVGPAPDETAVPEPAPVEPEVVVVTVDRAEATLLLVWDADGGAWLVPGFAMPHPDGWWNTVISLDEGVIQLPEPMQIEPLILEDDARLR